MAGGASGVGMTKMRQESEILILSCYCSISFQPFLHDTFMSDFPTPGSWALICFPSSGFTLCETQHRCQWGACQLKNIQASWSGPRKKSKQGYCHNQWLRLRSSPELESMFFGGKKNRGTKWICSQLLACSSQAIPTTPPELITPTFGLAHLTARGEI